MAQRRAGRAVLFIHHSARNGRQRGSSRREDMMDTILGLRLPPEAEAMAGACFAVHVEKSRGLLKGHAYNGVFDDPDVPAVPTVPDPVRGFVGQWDDEGEC